MSIKSVHNHMTEFMRDELKLPNHSYEIPRKKVKWFMKALSQMDLDFEDKLQAELTQLAKEHDRDVRKYYAHGDVTSEGVPIRRMNLDTNLEKVICIAWVMNNEFWAHGMMNPDHLQGIEYFSTIRLNYPKTYAMLLEWAWG